MPKFPTLYAPRERKFVPSSRPGDRVRVTYDWSFDENGKKVLGPAGKIDQHEYIQSHRSSVELSILLDRYRDGDESALDGLNRSQPFFGDVTEAPKTLADYYQRIADAEKLFYSYDPKVRAAFNNSPSQFFVMLGQPEKFEKMMAAAYGEPVPAKPEKEVTLDEQKRE